MTDASNLETQPQTQLRSRLLVPSTLLFSVPIVLILNQVATNLKFLHPYSYILLLIGAFTIFRIYLLSFVTIDRDYQRHHWASFLFNLIMLIVGLWGVQNAVNVLMVDSVAQEWYKGLIVSNFAFLLQVWVNKIGDQAFQRVQIFQLLLLTITYGALLQKIFDAPWWFLILIAILLGVAELYLSVTYGRLLFKWEASKR